MLKFPIEVALEKAQLNILTDANLLKELKRLARKEGYTLTEFVNNMIKDTLGKSDNLSLESRVFLLEEQMKKLGKISHIIYELIFRDFYIAFVYT